MYALAAIGFLVFVGGFFALLTWLNERQMARTLAPYLARPKAELPDNLPAIFYGGPVGHVARPTGHSGGAMRAYRTEAALGPVLWRDDGELLPAIPEPPTVRIGGRSQPEPEPATSENWTPARTPNLEADVAVPGLQAVLTALAAALCAGLLAWAWGWSWKAPVVVAALTLAGSWLWRLGVADSLLWAVESFTGRDLTGDNHVGRPAVSFTLANPATARQTVTKEARQTAASQEHADLLTFLDRCYMIGCGEPAHGVKATGPARVAYTARRDALMGLGLATWKNPDNHRAGWKLTASRQRARQLLQKHVL